MNPSTNTDAPPDRDTSDRDRSLCFDADANTSSAEHRRADPTWPTARTTPARQEHADNVFPAPSRLNREVQLERSLTGRTLTFTQAGIVTTRHAALLARRAGQILRLVRVGECPQVRCTVTAVGRAVHNREHGRCQFGETAHRGRGCRPE